MLKGKLEVQPSSSAEQEIAQLNKLSDAEKLKVFDYLNSLKNLHEPAK